jgi:hypothetical protein
MEVIGLLHDPAILPSRKEPQVPIGQEAWWDPETGWTLWSRKKTCLLRESNPGRLVRSPAIPIELFRLCGTVAVVVVVVVVQMI